VAARDNPALVVEHGSHELKQVTGGGGGRKLFAEVTANLRKKTAAEWKSAADESLNSAAGFGFDAGVLKIKLRSKAIAKSHRPKYLLQQAGRARIIGATQIGTLLVAVSRQTADAGHDAILNNATKDGTADLTTIESIEQYKPVDVAETPLEDAAAYERGAVVTLFDFHDEELNSKAQASVRLLLGNGVALERELPAGRFLLRAVTAASLRNLARHPAIRRIWPNSAVTGPTGPTATFGNVAIAPPQPDIDYPVVGVLDDGFSTGATGLAPWVDVGPSFPPNSTDPGDYRHGTFIAGLIAAGEALNPGLTPFPEGPCRVFAARVFSGQEGVGLEDLLARVQAVVRDNPKIKVWNLSLGIPRPCHGPEFSVFAHELDEIARRHRVLFVIAAGNYAFPPLRGWPADGWHTDGRDIIGPPADSVLGLTVGSVAPAHGNLSAVKKDEPAGYTRRGPAPGLLPKPEVVHFGGNCSATNGPDGHGMASIAPNGDLSRDWGTSYAAPLVATVAAHAWEQLRKAEHEVTPEMVRAIVIHSAALASIPRKPADLRYFGFGVPAALSTVLTCDSSAFTTWHRVYIPNGQFVAHEFPMPDCLIQGGRFSGEIVMTLCYAPPLDPSGGAEYCRSNVNVKMGVVKPRRTLKRDPKTGKSRFVMQSGFRGEVPPDPRSPGEGYEAALIEHGFKWSPIKVYRKRFPRGIDGARWQLQFEVLYRAGEPAPDQPQEAFAIVTVRALDEGQPVYRDGVRAIQQKGHIAHSALSLRTRIRR
jgi:hypothetical protein